VGIFGVRKVALPPRFEAVGEALVSGSGSVEACDVVGSDLARDGVPLEEALDALATTYRMVRGGDPDHAATRALALGWSEATLGYLNRLSREDPLTGLASMAHLRSRLTELYRGRPRDGVCACDTHALVVVDVPMTRGTAQAGRIRVEQALRASRVGEVVRSVLPGTQTIGRVGPRKVVVLCARDDLLGSRVAVLRQRLVGPHPGVPPARVWIEELPDSDDAAAALLDGLARG
jgi:GGDEF domain-containing protein